MGGREGGEGKREGREGGREGRKGSEGREERGKGVDMKGGKSLRDRDVDTALTFSRRSLVRERTRKRKKIQSVNLCSRLSVNQPINSQFEMIPPTGSPL